MGDARRRAFAQQVAATQLSPGVVKVSHKVVYVGKQLELACGFLQAVADQLASLGVDTAPEELMKSAEYLAAFRDRYIAGNQTRVVLASPADLPATPPALIR